jgi:hypothetical protein
MTPERAHAQARAASATRAADVARLRRRTRAATRARRAATRAHGAATRPAGTPSPDRRAAVSH